MSSQPSTLRGFLAGAVGGAIGTVVLNLFQTASLKGTSLAEDRLSNSKRFTAQQQQLLKSFEKAHTQTAQAVAHAVGTSIPRSQRDNAALATEFAFGILCAGVYGALAESLPVVTAGFGSVYGATLFAGASEVVLPAINLVPSPTRRTPTQHLGGLAGNVVYGLTTEAVRRLLR